MWIDDDVLNTCEQPLTFKTWIPESPVVVIGNSNVAEEECHTTACREDQVEILQRYGGGGTVLLYDGCVVLSLGIWVADYYKNNLYFQKINQAAISLLAQKWPEFMRSSQDGLSDIVFEGRKYAGTSLFRSRNFLLYQASIICELDINAIARYLKHPTKEPGYRAARSHQDFLVATSSVHSSATAINVHELFEKKFTDAVKLELQKELVDPIESQIPTIKQRAADSTR
jgi:lipoate-protein ligase A